MEKGKSIVGIVIALAIGILMILPAGTAIVGNPEVSADQDSNIYILQMDGPVLDEYTDTLDHFGVERINYISGVGYEVKLNSDQKDVVNGLPFVKDVSIFPISEKISPDLAQREVTISFVDTGSLRETLTRLPDFMSVDSESSTPSGYIVHGTLKNIDYAFNLATLPDVHFIAPHYPEELHSEIAAQISGGGAWYFDDDANMNTPYRALGDHGTYVGQLGWTGAGVRIAVADTGIGDGTTGNAGHNDLTGRVVGGYDFGTGGWTDQHGHGTHCTGLAAGDTYNGNGVTYAGFGPYYAGQGQASDSTLFAEQIFEGAAGSWVGPADYRDIIYEGYNGGAQVQTNSWGSPTGGAYSAHDEAYDQTIRDADTGTAGNQQMVIFASAGNDGPTTNTIGSPGNAKNIITVGGVQNYAPDGTSHGNTYGNSNNPDAMYSSSSRGWTDDGRIKPDILTPGQNTLSLRSPSELTDHLFGFYSDDTRYQWCTGTSQSCPQAAGAGAVIYGWYDATYGTPPTPATVKALMVNTAVDIGTADIPNQNEGWGRMNIMPIIEQPAPFIIRQDPTELTTGVTDTYTFSYANAGEPLKITLAYTDRYSLSGANPALQNQVNLEVQTPLGTIYHGNAFSGGWSTTGNPPATFDTNADGYDDRNNVESVYIPSGSLEVGQYTVRIIGTNVPADCDFDGSNDQDYSLVIFNGLDVSSIGTVDLDQSVYMNEDTATITVKDADLNINAAVQTHSITVDSTSEPGGESVLLTETGGDTGIFVGTLTLSATNGAGILQVAHGDTVTATYNDADDGSGSPAVVTDTATIDGQVQSASALTVDWWGSTSITWIDEDFSSGVPPTGWAQDGTAPGWAQVGSASAGGTAPEANLHWINTVDSWHLYAGPFDTTGLSSMDLEWRNYINDYGAGVDLSIQTSTDASSWTNAGWSWSSGSGDSAAQLITRTINTADVGSSTFYMSWSADGNLYQIDDWFIDDVLLTSAGGSTTDDNLLNWTLSGDDGGGANDVSHYNIYRADNPGGPWGSGALYDTVPAGTDTYTDFDAGEFDGTTWYYVVRAVDGIGNEDTNSNAVPEPGALPNPPYDMSTSVGWNFVSFPIGISGSPLTVLDDSTLGDGGTTWTIAQWYDPTDSADPWKSYNKNYGGTQELTFMDNTYGIWLYVTSNGGDGVLTTGTAAPYSTVAVDINLEPGWNLVGFPSATSQRADTTLPAEVTKIAEFDAGQPYHILEKALNQVWMSEGNAYWVYSTSATTWSVAP